MGTKFKKMKLWEHSQTCFVCAQKIDDFRLATLEHIIPLSKGGTNKKDNLALSHFECNQIKANSTHSTVWRSKIDALLNEREIRIWRKSWSLYSLKVLLKLSFKDLDWLNGITKSAFRCVPYSKGISIQDRDLWQKNLDSLRKKNLEDLIESSKRIDHPKTHAYWRMIFGILFIDYYLKQGNILSLLHAIWRLKQLRPLIHHPIMAITTSELIDFTQKLDSEAFQKIEEYMEKTKR
jgi:hypothetical protein